MSTVMLTGPQLALGWLAAEVQGGCFRKTPSTHVTSPETQGIANLCSQNKPSNFPVNVQRPLDYFLGAPAQNLLPPHEPFRARVQPKVIQGL